VCLPAAAARKGVRGPETTAIAGRSAELDLGGPKALAAELADRGIRVNAVAPGATNTLFTGTSFAEPEVFATFVDRPLIKRVGEPEDMAAAVSFLLSDDASYITGVQLPVDGGWLVR
jgi:NAD(P)-dependent dehydrogenase (short-subunit alcohol dehydrogenase family)